MLRKLAATVDFSFVSDQVRDCYSPDKGRLSWDPPARFKVVFLLFDKLRVVSNVEPQFLYDLSDREIEEQIDSHLVCEWFADLQPEEKAPDRTVLSRAEAMGR